MDPLIIEEFRAERIFAISEYGSALERRHKECSCVGQTQMCTACQSWYFWQTILSDAEKIWAMSIGNFEVYAPNFVRYLKSLR